jgi:putative flippase GtrA
LSVLSAILTRVGFFAGTFVLLMVTSWLIFLIVVLWATRVEGLSLSTLGLKRPTLATFGWSLVGVMATYVALDIMARHERAGYQG